ncbi:MATH domain and coiled-coil domain-containing protein At2g42480-like [Capsella rubella]|uniref:MATH domain and coiled-coil domain-containing protein At2g42480-like n=1 Tax=Capsella rubella TaxID=81985 RepID=UPI000CD4F3AE|nr:MATH domain and coiled-coil domain-containing protein At2g42480-like [Capsella rubella]
MGNQVPRSFRFKIDNFSEKEAVILSPIFISGGCEWYLRLYPKGNCSCNDHTSLFLSLANPQSLPTGWIRKARYDFLLLNQSGKVLYRTHKEPGIDGQPRRTKFCSTYPSWGYKKTLPYINLNEKSLLEKDRLIVDVYIWGVELVDVNGRVVKEKQTVDINGFQVFPYQVTSARKIFAEHPEIAKDFKPKNQFVKKEYMNVLLNLVETLSKPSQNHSNIEIRSARSKLSELMEQGFKLDWLKLKLEKVSLERKKPDDAHGSRVKEMEGRIKSLEKMVLDLKSKLDEVYLKRKKADADVQQLDERVKKLEQMKVDVKLDCLMKKLEEVSLERKKSYDLDCSLFVDRVKNLELMELGFKLDSLETKLEKFLMETKNADADGSRVQQVEESVKNLKMMVLDLKVEVDKKKTKSCADGFMLVDDIA